MLTQVEAIHHTNEAVRIALDLIHHRGRMTAEQRQDAYDTAHKHLDASQEIAGRVDDEPMPPIQEGPDG